MKIFKTSPGGKSILLFRLSDQADLNQAFAALRAIAAVTHPDESISLHDYRNKQLGHMEGTA